MHRRDVVDRMAGLPVVVVGDALLDTYCDGHATRLCREAPVPLLELDRRHDVAGGAANTAANAAALGAAVRLVSVVGADDEGARLRRVLHGAGVDDTGVVTIDQPTNAAVRYRADDRLLLRVDLRPREAPDTGAVDRVVERLEAALAGALVVIVSDYERGVLSDEVVAALERARHERLVVVVDAKHPARFRGLRPTAVKPNWTEARLLLGDGAFDGVGERAEGIALHGERLLSLTGARIAAVTLDTDGAVVFERGRPPHRTYANRRAHARAIGAGDTYTAAFALALGVGAEAPLAAELAATAADCVLDSGDTVPCDAARLRHAVDRVDKLVDPEALRDLWAAMEVPPRVVLTAGWFDRLNRAHITFLNRAKTRGDVLVVAMNDGEGDPSVTPLEDRAAVVSELSCVDHVVTFAEPTPARLLEVLRPDLFVKGGDHRPEDVPELAAAGRLGIDVAFLPEMEDRRPVSGPGQAGSGAGVPVEELEAATTRREATPHNSESQSATNR